MKKKKYYDELPLKYKIKSFFQELYMGKERYGWYLSGKLQEYRDNIIRLGSSIPSSYKDTEKKEEYYTTIELLDISNDFEIPELFKKSKSRRD